LRSASVFNGAPQIKIKSDSLRIVDTFFVLCRSRLAGEKREDAVFIQMLYTTQAGCQAAVLLLLILILGAPSNTLAGIRQGFGG
ncbi:hypothetical protein, partial [Pseudomonas sp. IPO3749]